MSTILSDNWWSVERDFVVHDEQRIVGVDNIVVDTNTVQVLLKQVLEELVFFLKCGLLLFNRKLVKKHLVKALVEVIESLKLIVCIFINALDLFNFDIRLFVNVRIRLIEW